MEKQWQLQEAKNRFSEMVNDAITHGPQWVTRHGQETVVVLSVKDYKKLARPEQSLLKFLQKSPFRDVELDVTRSKDLPREIDL